MYEIDYFSVDEMEPLYININSNHLPQTDDDVTIDGVNYKVIEVQHIFNTVDVAVMINIEEKFIVKIQKRK
tara:strand:+ start:166 stop:378 length:213 start_codon:yes stop_codon:yes gene_type:complete